MTTEVIAGAAGAAEPAGSAGTAEPAGAAEPAGTAAGSAAGTAPAQAAEKCTDQPAVSVLTTKDWNEEWKELQKSRARFDDPSGWDARAANFSKKHGDHNPYADAFIQGMQLQPCDSVFDMGCGNGALALPLAQMGHKVMACDFSGGMLEVLHRDAEENNITGVETKKMSWEDDWKAFGIEPKSYDVAIASRSISTADLGGSLMKLDGVARRRCCITLPCGPSPKVDNTLLAAAGFEPKRGCDFIYAFNILVGLNRLPEVSYIPSARVENFPSFEEALAYYGEAVKGSVRELATCEELRAVDDNLKSWLKSRLICDDAGYHFPTPRATTWAFIAWEPKEYDE